MSVSVMSLVMQHYPGAGGEYTLALCLADVANNEGESIWRSVATLAHNSRQSVRTVQRQLKAMVGWGWLEVVDEGGGAGKPTHYRIAPDWMASPSTWQKKGDNLSPFPDKKGDSSVTVPDPKRVTSEAKKGDTAMSPEQLQNLTSPPLSPQVSNSGCAVPSDGIDAMDLEQAQWMFSRVLALHPNHRPPNWRRWCRELRLLRERDGRSREQIAVLFRWANEHSFWAANILSPGTLRHQWDKLVIQRNREGGQLGVGDYQPADRRCVRCADGTLGTRLVPGIGHLCNHHIDEHEGLTHA